MLRGFCRAVAELSVFDNDCSKIITIVRTKIFIGLGIIYNLLMNFGFSFSIYLTILY